MFTTVVSKLRAMFFVTSSLPAGEYLEHTSHNENEIVALSKKLLNKLFNDTKLSTTKYELLLLKIQEEDGVFFLLFSLNFTTYFAQYLKIRLVDIRYLLV